MTKNLTPRQRNAIAALLTYPNVTAAAKSCGTSRETIYRWLELDAFRAALGDAEAGRLDALQRGLLAVSEDAITTLADLLKSENDNTRLRAAVAILAHAVHLREVTVFEERLRRLEERQP